MSQLELMDDFAQPRKESSKSRVLNDRTLIDEDSVILMEYYSTFAPELSQRLLA